jgi:uncharacterized membrane protein YidH (DUF202 family)
VTDISRLVALCFAAVLMALGSAVILSGFKNARPGDPTPFLRVVLFIGSFLLVVGVAIIAAVEP